MTGEDNSIDIAITKHPFSLMVMEAFMAGCGADVVIPRTPERCGPNMACYGILRGCGEALKRAENYWYIDHGFFGRSDPAKGDGYYRVLQNRMWPESTDDGDWTRFNALGVEARTWRKTGTHIVVVPPSEHMSQFLGLENWLEQVLLRLDQLTDRPVIVSRKGSSQPGRALFANAWLVITEHSQLAIDAMMEGIPAIMLSPERKLGSLEQIEDPPMQRDFFSRLANSQFTLAEMASGECWERLTAKT